MPLPVMALSLPLAGVVFMAAAMLYSRFLAGPLGRRPGIPKIWYKLPFLIILVAELVLSYRVWAGVELSPSPFYFLSGGGWSAAVSGEDLKNAQALLKVDAFGAVSAMLMSFVALVAGLRALSDKRNLITPRKAAFFLLTCAGIQGMFYSSGLAVLFVFMMMTQAGVTGLYSNFAVGEKRPGGKHVLYYVSRVVLLAMFLAGAVMLRLEYGTDNITTLASLIKGTPSSLAAFVLMTVPLLYIFFKPSPHLSDASKMCFFGIRTQASLFAAFRVIFSLYGPLDGLQKVPALLVMLGFASMIMAVVFQSGGKSPVHFMDSMIMYIKGMVIVTMGIAVSGTFGAERAALYGVSALESMIGLWLIFLPVAAALSVVTVYLKQEYEGCELWQEGMMAERAPLSLLTLFIVVYALARMPVLRHRLGRGMVSFQALDRGGAFGLPPALQSGASSLGNVVLQQFMNGFGAQTVAAITTAYRVDTVILLPIVNLGSGIATVVAQNYGAGNEERSRSVLRTGLVMMCVVSLVLTAIVFLFGGQLIALFGLEEATVAIGRGFFNRVAAFYIVYGLAMAFRGALEGRGDMLYSGIAGILFLVVRIIGSYAMDDIFGNMVIAWAEAIAWIFLLLEFVVRYWYRTRREPC